MVFAISVTVPEKSEAVADCHFVTVPVLPDNVKVVEFVPVHTVVLPAIVPPTEAGDTVMVVDDEFADEHAPLVTTARIYFVLVRLLMFIDVAVIAVSTTPVVKLELDDICHFVTVPV